MDHPQGVPVSAPRGVAAPFAFGFALVKLREAKPGDVFVVRVDDESQLSAGYKFMRDLCDAIQSTPAMLRAAVPAISYVVTVKGVEWSLEKPPSGR